MTRGRLLWLGGAIVAAAAAVLVVLARQPAGAPSLEAEVTSIASQLRCPECQNLSVADSPSGLAREMRAEIARRLRDRESPSEIRDSFVARYGDWILLAPRARGIGAAVWAVPAIAVGAGIASLALLVVLRRRRLEEGRPPTELGPRIERELALLEEAE